MRDHRPVLRSATRARHASYVVLVVLCATVLTFGAVFYVWQRYQFIRLGFQVEALRSRKAALEEILEPLIVEADYLARPERLETIARERLGLRPPTTRQVIVIEDTLSEDSLSKDYVEPAPAP